MGDINQDGIPDTFALRYNLQAVAGGETNRPPELVDVSRYNGDQDFLPVNPTNLRVDSESGDRDGRRHAAGDLDAGSGNDARVFSLWPHPSDGRRLGNDQCREPLLPRGGLAASMNLKSMRSSCGSSRNGGAFLAP